MSDVNGHVVMVESDTVYIPIVRDGSSRLGGTVKVLCITELDLNSVLLDSVDLSSNSEHT